MTQRELAVRAEVRWTLEAFSFFLFAMTYEDATFIRGIESHSRALRETWIP